MSTTKEPFTQEQVVALAANAVTKVDLLGERGATLCSQDEIVAMAILLAASGAVPAYPDRKAPPNPNLTPKGMKI